MVKVVNETGQIHWPCGHTLVVEKGQKFPSFCLEHILTETRPLKSLRKFGVLAVDEHKRIWIISGADAWCAHDPKIHHDMTMMIDTIEELAEQQ